MGKARILGAMFGYQNQCRNVTSEVERRFLGSGRWGSPQRIFHADNKIFGDPARGKVKTLFIIFENSAGKISCHFTDEYQPPIVLS